MGTYTTNYNLFMPTVGEQGWGTLINGNFTAIDTAMMGLNTRLTTVENEVNDNLNCTSVATSGTITASGMIYANGGVSGGAITGTTITATDKFSGTLYGKVYVNAKTSTTRYNNDVQYATCAEQSVNTSCSGTWSSGTSSTITINGYSKISMSYPYQLYPGIFIASSGYLTDSVPSSLSRSVSITYQKWSGSSASGYGRLYVNGTNVLTLGGKVNNGTYTGSYTVKSGDKVYVTVSNDSNNINGGNITATISTASNYYINTV